MAADAGEMEVKNANSLLVGVPTGTATVEVSVMVPEDVHEQMNG